jgi:hypothetical protein
MFCFTGFQAYFLNVVHSLCTELERETPRNRDPGVIEPPNREPETEPPNRGPNVTEPQNRGRELTEIPELP